jgi:hypothetical protein
MNRIVQLILGVLAAIVVIGIGVWLWNAATGGEKTAPKLEVSAPAEGASVSGNSVEVRGKTREGAEVRVDNRPVKVEKDGSFKATTPLADDQRFIFVKATHEGRDTIVQRSVTRSASTAAVPTISGSGEAAAPQAGAPTAGTSGQPLSQSGPAETLALLGAMLVAGLGVAWRKSRQSA